MPRVVFSVTAPPRERAPVRPPEVAPIPRAPAVEGGPLWRRVDPWRFAPTLVAALLALVYLIWEPRTVDLAAHVFRADLFGREGFTIWNGQWYGGHHTPAYSIISPPLAWLLGPPLALAIAAVSSAALFECIAHRHWGTRARWGAIWFGAGTATLLFTSRLPFALGVAFALAAVLALQRGRSKLAVALAVLSSLGSPVAGLFLAMAGLAYALAARGDGAGRKRREGVVLAAAAFVPPLFLSVAFPEGGWAPFPFSAYLPIPVFAAACLIALPVRERALKWGAALYGLGSTVALLLETPMGGNAVRLGALFGGPVLLCTLWGRWPSRRLAALALVPAFAALAFWQWSPAVRDLAKAMEDPAAKADYFEPLRQYLATLPDQRRIEIPFTRSHWEGAEIGPVVPLARGWLRQLDTGRHAIFYKGELNGLSYASWLAENAVRYVALPSVKPDKSSYRERALIERGLSFLRLRWRSEHWRVYEVILPAPFTISKGGANITLEQLDSDRLLLRVLRPGEAIVRVRWTPYWFAHGGCVERAGQWTRVTAPEEGFLRLTTRFAPERIFSRGRRCDDGSG